MTSCPLARWPRRDENWNCQPANNATITKFSNLLASCIRRAVDKGLNVGVLAHLDNAAVRGAALTLYPKPWDSMGLF